jgi:hypothetical protein
VTKTLPNPNDNRHLFIVRFWREESGSAPSGQWRGSVEHIPTGQRVHFVSLEVLNTFIDQRLNGETTGTPKPDGN